jgi:hypothetical protein
MRDLQFHFGNANDQNVVFGYPYYVHFGDQITFINLVRHLNLSGYKLKIDTTAGKELCSKFFDESIFTDEPATHHFHANEEALNEAYKCRYFKIKGDEIVRERKYISYAFDSITNRNHTPPYLVTLLEELKNKYGQETVVPVGLQIEDVNVSRINNTLDIIHQSKVFIGMDSGVSHLCRTTSTPHILLEHTNNTERTFPIAYSDHFVGRSMKSILEKVEELMIG